MQKKDQWSSTPKHDVTWDIKCSEMHKKRKLLNLRIHVCSDWFASPGESSPHLSLPLPDFFFFLCIIPSFTSFPPSLPWTQNALSLFPAAFEPRSEGTFWLAHITYTQRRCSFRCNRLSAVLIACLSVSLSLYLDLWLSNKANGNISIIG